MSHLYFKTGTMGSGKSYDLIRVAKQYERNNIDFLAMKSIIDDREGKDKCIIKSRGIKDTIEGIWIQKDMNLLDYFDEQIEAGRNIKIVIIDEVQFLSVEQIYQLSDIVTERGVSVMCYGLKNDFTGKLFPSIAILFAYADKIEEIRSICWCGKCANHNARVINGKVVTKGDIIGIEKGNISYVPLCNKHFKMKKIKE